MRKLSRTGLVAAAAALFVIGGTGVALAGSPAESTTQVSQVTGGVNPNLQDDSKFKKGSLFTQVTTYDKDNDNGCGTPGAGPPPCDPVIPAQPSEAVHVDFDKDIVITTKKLKKCDHTASGDYDNDSGTPDQPFSTTNTDQALVACEKSLVGSGTAIARIPGTPTENSEVEETVTAFNGLESDGTTGFGTGNPTLILHADDDGPLPTTLVRGEIRPSPTAGTEANPNGNADGTYGHQLYVPDVPDLGSDFAALVFFNAQIQKTYKKGKKKFDYITARCSSDVGEDDGPGAATPDPDGEWDFRAFFLYKAPAALGAAESMDTDIYQQECGQK